MSSSINILGIRIDLVNISDILLFIKNQINTNNKSIISYVNIQALNLAYSNKRLQDYFNSSEVVFCDGFGIRIASRILSYELPQRSTPPDWIGQLFQVCVDEGYNVFFLGAKTGTAEKAAVLSTKKYPGLNICGTHHGFFDRSPSSSENDQVINQINRLSPDILLIGFGMPLQEYWIEENKDRLNVKIFLPVGALFDYLSGKIYRVPGWMTNHGLEWLGRLMIEPRRLWKRYILGIPMFFFRVFKELINKKQRK